MFLRHHTGQSARFKLPSKHFSYSVAKKKEGVNETGPDQIRQKRYQIRKAVHGKELFGYIFYKKITERYGYYYEETDS